MLKQAAYSGSGGLNGVDSLESCDIYKCYQTIIALNAIFG